MDNGRASPRHASCANGTACISQFMGNKSATSSSLRREDALAQFCEQLCTPLEQAANFVYLASHWGLDRGLDRDLTRRHLSMATKILDDLRKTVLAHCRTGSRPREQAS